MCARALHLPSSHTHALWGLGFTEALLLEQLDKLLIAVPVEVYPLHLLVAVVEDDQVRVVMVNPLDIQVLVILPLLVVFEERSKLDVGRVIQASARAALKASLGPARSATTTSQQMGRARTHTHTQGRGRPAYDGFRLASLITWHSLSSVLPSGQVEVTKQSDGPEACAFFALTPTAASATTLPRQATVLSYSVHCEGYERGGCRTQPRIPAPWYRRLGVLVRTRTIGDSCRAPSRRRSPRRERRREGIGTERDSCAKKQERAAAVKGEISYLLSKR